LALAEKKSIYSSRNGWVMAQVLPKGGEIEKIKLGKFWLSVAAYENKE
jgi:hypothetical protein